MKNRALVGTLATFLVVALVVAGLLAIGSPATARKYKADQERRNRLTQLPFVLATHVRDQGSLPEDLGEMNEGTLRDAGFGFDARRDPESGDFFEYSKLEDRRYEVCATFHTSSDDRRAQEFGYFGGDVSHSEGRNCYERRITDGDVETAPFFGRDFFQPVPGPVEETTDPAEPVPESPEPEPEPEDDTPAAGELQV